MFRSNKFSNLKLGNEMRLVEGEGIEEILVSEKDSEEFDRVLAWFL